MNGKLIVGAIVLILGFMIALFGFTVTQEYQTTAGQISRGISQEAEDEYVIAQGMTCFGGIFIIIGIIAVALGLKSKKEESKPVITISQPSPIQSYQPPPPPPPKKEEPPKKQTSLEKLQELQEMKENGLITEKEFERKKKEILDQY